MAFKQLIAVGLILTAASVTGCFTTWDTSVSGGVGWPLEHVTKGYPPPEEVVVLSDGNKEYKYHLSFVDKTCYQFWIVNDEDIVVDYRYTGHCVGL